MEGIFKDINDLIFEQDVDYLDIRNDHKQLIQDFLQSPNTNTANLLFSFIHRVHQKGPLYELMQDLRQYECSLTEIIPNLRDHYCHSASVYALGLGLYNVSGILRGVLETRRHINIHPSKQKPSFLFRWSLAACLHDVAYPLELSLNCFHRYAEKLHGFGNLTPLLNINSDIYRHLNLLPILHPEELIAIDRKDTSLGLISHCLTWYQDRRARITYDTLRDYLDRHITTALSQGKIDHGIFSALVILKRVHELYEENQWDIQDYYYEVVDSATAIFLHNVYRYSKLKDIFGNGKYRYDFPSPLGYLLFVSDTLCEWLRQNENDASFFHVCPSDENIIFKLDAKYEDKMKNSIELFDENGPVQVQFYPSV